jgi:hypothetical protein
MSEEETQQPEKPKKKKAGLSMPILIGIIAGIVLLLIVGVVFFMKIFFIDPLKHDVANGGNQKEELANSEEAKKKAAEKLDEEFEKLVAEGLAENVEEKLIQTGRIITNPRGSTSYVVLDLALIYKFKKLEGEPKKEEKKEGEGAKGEGSQEEQIMNISIKSIVSSTLGGMTIPELQDRRDSLESVFHEKLKPVFKKEKKILTEVKISEFIIQ